MNDLINPPAERDLPPGRAARMRAEILTATRVPHRRATRWRLVVPVAAVLTLIAGVALTLQVREDGRSEILAMSRSELDPALRRAAKQCLTWMEPASRDPSDTKTFTSVSLADVTMAARQGGQSVIMFMNRKGHIACQVTEAWGKEVSGSISDTPWTHRDWLPGPVERVSLSSSEIDGGSVAALGRVSARVHRLVLEHGTGRTTAARLSGGLFGLISKSDDVRRDAELVSYDAGGREIDRRPLFQTADELGQCYTDPAGKLLYGPQGPNCLPADPWTP